MNKTAIEWCDMTFNPVTGCLHGCEYCYARRITERFGGKGYDSDRDKIHILNTPKDRISKRGWSVPAPFPFGFDPTFHRYRLGEPQGKKKPQTIFVCSMADLFGEWVPDEWIAEAFEACRKAPQHRYMFLTKNPTRYMALASIGKLPKTENFWYGSTATGPDMPFWQSQYHNTFVSIELLLQPFDLAGDDSLKKVGWIVLGAMTGPGSQKHQPQKSWVEDILADADKAGIPVLMKESLRPFVGEENMRREFPWGRSKP